MRRKHGLLNRVAPVTRLCDHLPVRTLFEDLARPVPHERVIVGQQDSKHGHRTRLLGGDGFRRSERIEPHPAQVRHELDEFTGMLVTLVFVPVGVSGAVVGFVPFRAFDVAKPFPTRACERLKRGPGIIADDVVAGLHANLALRVALRLLPSFR